jgi:class 3 adenylate cyclase/ligand-binding sensor domain-containing protein
MLKPPLPFKLHFCNIIYILLRVYFFFVLLSQRTVAQTVPPHLQPSNYQFSGNIFIQNFSNQKYKAHPQNWEIIQDKRGFIYVANPQGVLEFDGIRWRIIENTRENAIHSLACDENNTIFVGCYNNIGKLTVDSTGNLVYKSLNFLLPKDKREFGEVWRTHAIGSQVFFQTSNYIFVYSNNSIKIIEAEENKNFSLSYLVNNKLYVSQDLGLYEWKENKLTLIPETENLYGLEIISLLPHSASEILLIMTDGQKWILSPGKPKKRWITQDESLFKNILYYNAIKLRDGSYILGSITGEGAIHINQKGELLSIYNKKSGLQDVQIYYLMQDILGGVWLCLNHGISRIEITSPLSFFDEKLDLNGSVYDIELFNNKLYISTSAGIYYKEPSSNGKLTNFYKLESIKRQAWALCNTGNHILLGCSKDIYQLDANHVLKEIYKDNTLCLLQSRFNKNIVYGGGEKGVNIFMFEGGNWKFMKHIEIEESSVRTLAEDEEGNLWAGCEFKGVYRLKPFALSDWRDYKIQKFNTFEGRSEKEVNVFWVNQKILVATSSNGVFYFDKNSGAFRQTFELKNNKDVKKNRIFQLCQGENNYIYYVNVFDNTKEEIIEVQQEKNKTVVKDYLFKRPGSFTVNSIKIDRQGVVWVCSADGVIRYNPKIPTTYNYPQFSAIVRKVSIAENHTIFNGAYALNPNHGATLDSKNFQPPILNYSATSDIRFECAAPFFDGLEFQEYRYFLEGFDLHWSDWTNIPIKAYTNLPEGNYNFKVQAKNVYGLLSQEGNFSFIISPPWYRTIWAYLSYFFGGLGLVYGIVKWRSQALEKENKILEIKVLERTAELQKANAEITKQNESLSQAYEEIRTQNKMLEDANFEISKQKSISDKLLLNILPQETAEELKTLGRAKTKSYDLVSVLFTDFKGFTNVAEKLTPEELVREIDFCFSYFDNIIEEYKLEKIKTIGDAYMCAGGIPTPNRTNPIDSILAGLAIQEFMLKEENKKKAKNEPFWQLRLGIHTGPLVAGVVGNKKFAYDIWGDTVNTASRMESSGEVNKVNISQSTYELVADFFDCQFRGYVEAKNKGKIAMYFVENIKRELSIKKEGKVPNNLFWEKYQKLT